MPDVIFCQHLNNKTLDVYPENVQTEIANSKYAQCKYVHFEGKKTSQIAVSNGEKKPLLKR